MNIGELRERAERVRRAATEDAATSAALGQYVRARKAGFGARSAPVPSGLGLVDAEAYYQVSVFGDETGVGKTDDLNYTGSKADRVTAEPQMRARVQAAVAVVTTKRRIALDE